MWPTVETNCNFLKVNVNDSRKRGRPCGRPLADRWPTVADRSGPQGLGSNGRERARYARSRPRSVLALGEFVWHSGRIGLVPAGPF